MKKLSRPGDIVIDGFRHAALVAVTGFVLLQASLASAAAIVYNATLDDPQQFTDAGLTFTFVHYSYQPTAPAPSLTGDFAVDKVLEITYSAPAGMQFQVSGPPSGATQFILFADFWTTGFISSIVVNAGGGSLSFAGAVGTPPTLFDHLFRSDASDPTSIEAETTWNVTGPFAFQSLTMSFDVPATVNENFVDFAPAVVKLDAVATYRGTPDPTPERFLNLVPTETVPEPGTFALLGLGLAGLAASRRRRTI